MTSPALILPLRSPGWHGRLYRWALSVAAMPHVYGSHDCALFVGGAIDAMHGTDLAGRWRGRYHSYQGGLRLLRAAGYRDHLDLLARIAQPVAAGSAQIGDITVIGGEGHAGVGVVMGETIQALGVDGLMSILLAMRDGATVLLAAREVWRT